MDFSDFYFLRNDDKRGNLNVSIDNPVAIQSIFSGEKFSSEKIIEPIGFHRNIGSRPKDLIRGSYFGINLLTERFFELLEKEGFTGWGFYPVKIRGKNDEPVEGYRGLRVHGKCCAPDYSRRERIERINEKGKISIYWKGYYFDLASWDGSDFFCPEGTLAIIVPKRVKDSIEKGKFSNISFHQITEDETIFNFNADGKIIYR